MLFYTLADMILTHIIGYMETCTEEIFESKYLEVQYNNLEEMQLKVKEDCCGKRSILNNLHVRRRNRDILRALLHIYSAVVSTLQLIPLPKL